MSLNTELHEEYEMPSEKFTLQTAMVRLDRFVRRHRRAVIALWLIALVAAVPFAMRQSENLTGGGYGVPGSQSQMVREQVERNYKNDSRATMAAVIVPGREASAGEIRDAIGRIDAAARDEALVALPPPARAAADAKAGAGRTIVMPLTVDVDDQDAIEVARGLRERLGLDAPDAAEAAVKTHLVGQGPLWARMQDVAKHDAETAERAGFPIVALILIAVFGSLAAAALPLVLGFGSVLVTGGLIYALSTTMEMSVFVTNMASMIGIGVAVDYSLFVLARYREEIAAGKDPEQARTTAMATSGLAVAFSGVTVIASLAGLFLIDTTAVRSMAIGAIVVVAVAIVASATLLPALISLLGNRGRARRKTATSSPFWTRWSAAVMKRPVVSLVAASAVLLALAAPALDLKTSNGALRQLDPQDETRQGFEAAAAAQGPGAATPVRVVAELHTGTATDTANRAAIAQLRSTLARDAAVAKVSRPVIGDDGRSAMLVAQLKYDGEAPAAKVAVARVRDTLPAASNRLEAAVGGTTATQEDFRETVSGSMWKIVLFVLALSFVLLTILLRSIVLPLKAVVMNLLSVGAAYGVLTLAFGEVDPITLPLVLAIVFGLSMDYEVFLLSRIKERYDATGDTRRAVAEGLASSARTISSAALIMVGVFTIFVFTGLPSVQQIGLGNAVAVAVDATIVRLLLMPATMNLLGKWNWWLPKRLERILPEANFEAEIPAIPAVAAVPAKPQSAWRRAATDRHFLRHYAEMVVVMLLGMAVLGMPLGAALDAIVAGATEEPAVMLLGMGLTMTVPMVAWMRLKHGHGWRASNEMAASMIVPTLLAIAAHAAGVASLDTILLAEHVVMLAAMYGVMLLRPSEYAGHAHHATA